MTVMRQLIDGYWFFYEEELSGMRVVDSVEEIDFCKEDIVDDLMSDNSDFTTFERKE